MIVPVRGMTVTVDGALVPVDGLTVEIPDPVTPPPGGGGGGGSLEELLPFVPVIGGDTETDQTYSTQRGYYARSKHVCNVWVYVQFSSRGTITGPLKLKGLPVPMATIPMFACGSCGYISNASPTFANVTGVMLYTAGTKSEAALFGFIPGQNPRPLQAVDINDHTQLIFQLTYPIDAPAALRETPLEWNVLG